MLSPRNYTACNQVDLRTYYTATDNPLSCGFCKEKNKNVLLHDYPLADGQTHWYVCPCCGFAGTGMEYLAKLDGNEVGQQIQILAEKGVIPLADVEDIRRYRKFKESREHWKERFSHAAAFQRNTTLAFAGMYDLDYYTPAQSFRQGTKQTFERLFRPSLQQKKYCTSSSRIFHGKWAKITAIPLYDLPLHISAVLFVNGHEHASQKCVIKRLEPVVGGQHLFDPGFLGTRMVCRPDQTAVVLCERWELALTLQAAIFRQENKHPPLLAWFPIDPKTKTAYEYSWAGLRRTSKIFWAPANSLASLREACLQEGMVSNVYFDHAGQFLPQGDLHGATLRSIISAAEPWHRVLTWYLEKDTSGFDQRLSKLGLPQQVVEKYLEHAPVSVRSKITERVFTSATAQNIYLDGSKVISNAEGWWKAGNKTAKTMLSNVRCSIEKVIHIADEPPIYQGKISVNGEEYPFTENETIFEKYPIPTIKRVCAEQQCPHFLRINVKNDQYLRLVKEISLPETVYRNEGYGWSKKEAALLLPNITLSDTLALDTNLSLQTGPFYKLTVKQTQPLRPAYRNILANFQEETPVIFSIFTALVPAIFSAAYRMPPPQTVAAGGEYALLKQVADLIGLSHMQIKDKDEIEKYTRLHRCPFLVRFGTSHKKNKVSNDWADVLGLTTPAVVSTSLTEALARMSYGGANLLLLPASRFYRWFDGKLPSLFQDCFAACLRHLSRYVLDPSVSTEDWNSDLLQETSRFFSEEIGTAPSADSLFGGYYDHTDYFYDYVNLLHRAELVSLENNETLYIGSLAECYRQHIGMFDFQRLYDNLLKSKAVEGYDPKRQVLILDTSIVAKSRKRLERFYGTLLRN